MKKPKFKVGNIIHWIDDKQCTAIITHIDDYLYEYQFLSGANISEFWSAGIDVVEKACKITASSSSVWAKLNE